MRKSVTSPPFLGGEFNTHGHITIIKCQDELRTNLKLMMVLDFHLFDSARILNLSDVQLQIIFYKS